MTVALLPFTVADGRIAEPLGGVRGDPERGRAVLADPERGNCAICHPVPGGDPKFQGNVGPSLAGVGSRLEEGQLRLRLVDGRQLNPSTMMPSYYRVEGLVRVGERWQGKPVLGAGEIEDLIAYLMTLRE